MTTHMIARRTTRLAPDGAPVTVATQYVTTEGEPDRIRVTITGPRGYVERERFFVLQRPASPVHLAHPADGLPVCATHESAPIVTTDPGEVTCARCREAQ